MRSRPLIYWFACTIVAAIAAGAAEPGMVATLPFSRPADPAMVLMPVSDPGRSVVLFLGVMAMAFTYRRAWLNWKRS